MSTTRFDPIIVKTNRFGAPGQFFWQGRTYPIEAIDRIWRHPHGRKRGRRLYKIRSRRQIFLLHFDQRFNRWSLVRAPWRTRLSLAIERLAAHISP